MSLIEAIINPKSNQDQAVDQDSEYSADPKWN